MINKLAVLLMAVLLPGCLLSSMSRPDNLTPEQIEAYGKVGVDVYQCFNVSGPPPSGGMTMFTVPRGHQFNGGWANNCQPINATVR